MKIYKSCATLPIRRFFRIFETNDLRNLIIGFNEENDEFELTPEEQEKFKDIFETIYYEYSEISENHKLRASLKKQLLINEWTFLYTMVSSILELYKEHGELSTLSLINNIDDQKYRIDTTKPINPQVDKLVKEMKYLKNKIRIFKLKLLESNTNVKKDVKSDLDRDALYLERNLELKRSIDPDITTVSSWVKMILMSKQKAKDYVRNTNHHKRSRGRD